RFLEDAFEADVDAIADGTRCVIGGVMQHIEDAGVHSGDSACVLPPYLIGDRQVEEMRRYTQAFAKALNVIGLINVQYAIRNGVVYVLEVNPRASRTVPFVSKATGIPLAKLAAKIMMGKKLSEVLPEEMRKTVQNLKWTSVKEAVLPWTRFPGVDAVLGPEMRSTGEVMGIASNFPSAYAKSQAAANSPLPTSGKILVSLKKESTPKAIDIAHRLHKLGFTLLATEGTARAFQRKGIPVEVVKKIAEGRPHVVDLIVNREVDLVINTPSGARSRKDGYAIRDAALATGLPIIT